MNKLIDIFNELADAVDLYVKVGDTDLKSKLKEEIEKLLDLFRKEL